MGCSLLLYILPICSMSAAPGLRLPPQEEDNARGRRPAVAMASLAGSVLAAAARGASKIILVGGEKRRESPHHRQTKYCTVHCAGHGGSNYCVRSARILATAARTTA